MTATVKASRARNADGAVSVPKSDEHAACVVASHKAQTAAAAEGTTEKDESGTSRMAPDDSVLEPRPSAPGSSSRGQVLQKELHDT
jgi:hypothetical protein